MTQYVIRFLMFVIIGIPLIFYNAHVFGQYMWPKLVWPIAPELFVQKLDMSAAIGFVLVVTWANTGLVRVITKYGTNPEKEMADNEKISDAFSGYLLSAVLTSIFWAITYWLF